MREQSFFEAGNHHHRKLQSLSRVDRHQPDSRVTRPGRLIGFREQRQAVDEARQRRFGLPRLVFAGRRDQFREIVDTALGLFAVFLPQIAQVAGLIEHLAHRNRDSLAPGHVGERSNHFLKRFK